MWSSMLGSLNGFKQTVQGWTSDLSFPSGDLVWVHAAVSSTVIGVAFLIVFFVFFKFTRSRKDLGNPYLWFFVGVSLLVTAALHFFRAWEAWHGFHPAEFILAGCSAFGLLVSAFFFWKLMPRVLRIPNPTQFQQTLKNFEDKIRQHQRTESSMLMDQKELERTVQSRTRELLEANRVLEQKNQEKEKIEQTLRESEKYFRALTENALGITVVLDGDGRIQYETPSLQRILGYPRGGLKGKLIFDYVHDDDIQRLKGMFIRGFSENEFFELTFRHFDGSWRVLEGIGRNLLNEPAIHGIIVNARDITERRKVEEEISFVPTVMQAIGQAENFISALEIALDKICELTGWNYGEIWIPRDDKKVLECSPVWTGGEKFRAFRDASKELKFLPDMELPGQVWISKKPKWVPDVTDVSNQGFIRIQVARQTGLKAGVGIPVLSQDNVLAVLVFFLLEERKTDDKLLHLVSMVAAQLGSILQRKKAQDELRRAHHDLEKRVHERTEQLAKSNQTLQTEVKERKVVAEALKRSEQKYQALVNSVEGILWEYDLAAERYTFISQQQEKILGYQIEQWLNEPAFWQDHVHGEDREAAVAFRAGMATSPGQRETEYRMITAAGKSLWFRDTVSPIYEDGKVVMLRGMMENITDRKTTEIAWQEERNFVSAVLDTASAIVMILNPEGNVVRMNRACEKMCGYKQKEIEQKTFWDVFVIPEEVGKVKAIFTRLMAGQFPLTFESSWRLKDGTQRVISWSNTVLLSKGKNTAHVIATGIDITNRKEAENNLQEAVKKLEEANKSLKKLDELKSGFISAASHELKTPLTSIKGYVEIVLNEEAGGLNPEQKEYLQYVKESTDRLHRLLKELLDISKIESGQARMRREPIDLKSMLKEEVALFKPLAQEKEISLSMDAEIDLKDISCDPDKIREVFDNLISNAIKYTENKGTVRVCAKNVKTGVEISVEDTGIGIRPDDLPRVFEPFHHIEKNGIAVTEESTGLGLTLVKKIVEAHGGNVEVQSDEGRGTVFTVTLPPYTEPKTIAEVIGRSLQP